MELKYLKTFKTILETGSFLNAARSLNYTQSTVTFQIQQLEQELSIKLFEKIGRRMMITQAGQAALPHIENVLQAVEQLKNCGKSTHELAGTLSIVMPESLLTYQMQPVLKAFREQAPFVKLSVQAMNCYDIREQLVKGGADIGIHYEVGGYSDSVIKAQMVDFPLALICSPKLESSLCDFMTSKQRKPLCLITADKRSIYHEIFEEYLKRQNIVLDAFLELGSLEAIKRSVISNLGIAYLPRYVVCDEIENGLVKELPISDAKMRITALCAYHKNKWLSPAMQLFIQLLNQNMWSKCSINKKTVFNNTVA